MSTRVCHPCACACAAAACVTATGKVCCKGGAKCQTGPDATIPDDVCCADSEWAGCVCCACMFAACWHAGCWPPSRHC